jgi:hypothetical protein
MDSKKIYKTYAEVFAAFKSGELDGYKLMLDNDCVHLQYCVDGPNTVEYDELCDQKNEQVEFYGEGYRDIDAILTAANIPNEWV